MPLEQGTRFGPYEIVAPLGAGGMGEVYKARDTRLDRTVAIKVLPSHIAQREDLRARFEREARAVSSLNHPNICSLFDVGRQDGVEYMVMEHVEGETLADRLARGPLPLDEALKYCMQIAEAVDRAHRSGVVHRDLKPANVMITRDGVKVLDFGLAKTAPKAAAASGDVTLTQALTNEGMLLGTLQYMSPEQIEGRAADARADIFAFGCLLYEAVTGKRAFDGKTKASVVGAILNSNPPSMTMLVPITPRRIETIVEQCLAKDPDERYQSLWDVLLDLRSIGDAQVVAAKPARLWIPWVVAAVFGVALLALATVYLRQVPPVLETARFHIEPPGETVLGPLISPDGRTIAVVAHRKLWIRPVGSLEFKPLEGAEDPTYPFWSPDSASLGFFAQGKLKKITPGNSAVTLCDAPNARGGTWSREGLILFGASGSHGIRRVHGTGGVPVPITKVDTNGTQHRYPFFLPDGRHFLFVTLSRNADRAGIYVGSLDGGTPFKIRPEVQSAAYAPPPGGQGTGHILFRRGLTLMAQPFDPHPPRTTGDMFPVAEQVRFSGNTSNGAFSVSHTGTLAYHAGQGRSVDLAWVDRKGRRLGVAVERDATDAFALSRDGRHVATVRLEENALRSDVWLHDTRGGATSRFTFGPPPGWNFPVWSRDGTQIAYATANIAGLSSYEIRRKSRDMTRGEEVLVRSSALIYPRDWSPDGKWLAYSLNDDVWLLPVEPRGKAIPFANTPAKEDYAQFSPDGQWIAYVSTESGREEVYVQPFPATGAKWQLSVSGGDLPRWRSDGKELFFVSGDLTLMAVAVRLKKGTMEHELPAPLFTIAGFPPVPTRYNYDMVADGQRFLVRIAAAGEKQPPITLVLNWQAGLQK